MEAAHALSLYNFVVLLVVIKILTKENLTKRNMMGPNPISATFQL